MNPVESWLKSQQSTVKRQIHLAIALGMLAGVGLIVQAWLLAQVINGVVIERVELAAVLPWLGFMLPIFVLRFVIVQAAERVAFSAAAQMQSMLRDQLYARLQALGPLWLATQASGDLANRVTTGIEALGGYYARWLPNRALSVWVPLMVLVVVFPADWVSGLVLALTAPLIPIFMILIGRGTELLNQRQWRQLARMSARFLDTLQGLTTLKLFNASRRETQVVMEISEAYRVSTMSVLRVAFLSSVTLEFLSTVSIAMVAVFIGFRLLWGDMLFLPGFFVLLLAPEFYLPLRNLGSHYHARMEAIGAAEGLVEIFHAPLPIVAAPQSDAPLPGGACAIEFCDVAFDYAPGRPALAGVSFQAGAGRVTALVGTSGAGKSTVLHLLLGLATAQGGRIEINGRGLSEYDNAAWLTQVAWVPQRPHVFDGTIRDNLLLARPAASMEAVEAAARAAHAHAFISALPQAYLTQVGERGMGLSGGQIQRLALARAFLKDAPLVLLDEATAHLDSETEALVMQAITELARGRTVIMAAHRFHTLALADHIVVLEQGRVVEQGNRVDLLARDGEFARHVRAHAVPGGFQ
jgi:ATP-binding cassette subfamily C protein CydD